MTKEYFRAEFIKRLAEAVEDEVVRANFSMGKYNDIDVCKTMPRPDYKWAENEVIELEEESGQKLSSDNVLQLAEQISEKLYAKIRTELKISFGEMMCHYYSIQAGAIEAKIAIIIQRSNDYANKMALEVNQE